MPERIDVALIGATGTVGVRLVELLQGHPWFRLTELGASAGSAGRSYGEALADLGEPSLAMLPQEVLSLKLRALEEGWNSPLVLSALPTAVAGPVEAELANRGQVVVSNAASHRMDPDVPLIVAELNPDHLGLLERQRQRWPGAIITNPNCSVIGLAVALAPIHRTFGVTAVTVATLQALSGAGRPGPSAGELLDNVLPFIPGEEEKIEREPQRILGELRGGEVRLAGFPVSAQAHRVSVTDGHLLAVSVKLAQPATALEVESVLSAYKGELGGEILPSAPERLIDVMSDERRPQPRLDRDRGSGMTVSVGRVRSCEVFDLKFTGLVHNLVRGAAGAALLNAELCHVRGLLGGSKRR